jgi:hypothetical protein
MKLETGRVMVVCSDVNDELESRLVCDGWGVTWVHDAKTAITRVRRERFDLVVLISTGEEMDIIETYFNLADIRRTLPVVFVRQTPGADNPPEGETVMPNTGLHSVHGLNGLISLLSREKIPKSAARH